MAVEQPRKQQRHERILESALQVFSRKGYHQTAVDDIALASETSKGGVYFHFPNKEAIFLALLDRMAALLRSRVEAAIAGEADPIAKADIALQVVLQTFASHRTLSRLFFVDALGAGRDFNERMAGLRASFAALIRQHLDEAVRLGAIPPLDTAVAARVWFGALNEVVTHWVLSEPTTRLEDSYPTVRALLMRSIGAQVPGVDAPGEPPAPVAVESTQVTVAALPGTRTWSFGEGADRLRALFEAAADRARQLGRPVAASLVLPVPSVDPLEFFARGNPTADRLAWTRPRADFALAGLEAAWALEVRGSGRFARAAAAWRDLCADALIEAPPDVVGVGPLALAGFAFDPARPPTGLWEGFADGRLVMPRYLLTVASGAAWLTVNTLLGPDDDPRAVLTAALEAGPALLAPHPEHQPSAAPTGRPTVEDVLPPAEWQALVASVRADIRAGLFEKVVLAREARLRAPSPLDPAAALRRLRDDYPSCFVFAIGQGERCFLGASPERLIRLRDGLVSTMCLAGSIARGATEAEDRRLGEALLASNKERSEHEIVVRGLRAVLGEVCDEIAPISTPVLLKVRNVQHLLTTVVGEVADGRAILDVVERLHPSPAVGGLPRAAALAAIRERERLDRGWYAGPVGWFDARGEGEFAVAIRSALLRGSEASLFAGCGIVADSDPHAELEESCLKLRPMLAALGGQA